MLLITTYMLFITETYKYSQDKHNSMTSVDEHAKNIKEMLKDINEKTRSDLIVERQR